MTTELHFEIFVGKSCIIIERGFEWHYPYIPRQGEEFSFHYLLMNDNSFKECMKSCVIEGENVDETHFLEQIVFLVDTVSWEPISEDVLRINLSLTNILV